uniref:DUF1330 domain-containing protein n=1 Tax=Heterorhabditis bacteriophora TaxID=37862 RepID=A0A1I7X6J8_HETBA
MRRRREAKRGIEVRQSMIGRECTTAIRGVDEYETDLIQVRVVPIIVVLAKQDPDLEAFSHNPLIKQSITTSDDFLRTFIVLRFDPSTYERCIGDGL